MSDAASPADAEAPAKGGKKKLVVIVLAVLVLAGAGVGGLLFMKAKAAHAHDEGAAEAPAAHAPEPHKNAKVDPKHPPNFLPLDVFVVNLADKESDRYAQVGITLEIDSPEFAEQIKAYMPAVRNSILMILAHKTSQELLERKGKKRLAQEIAREVVRPMGIEIDPPEPASAKKPVVAEADGDDDEVEGAAPRRKRHDDYNPVRHVHFSSFIIQ